MSWTRVSGLTLAVGQVDTDADLLVGLKKLVDAVATLSVNVVKAAAV